jgi:hypothetical protein
LPPEDVVMVRGFRVTSLVRTLIDLSGDVPIPDGVRIARQAIEKGLTSLPELRRAAETRTELPTIHQFREVVRRLSEFDT